MELFNVDDIAGATNGRVALKPVREQRIRSVVIDSRRAEKDSLFVALSGTRTDGHEYIGEAVRRGSTLCLLSGSQWERRKVEYLDLVEKEGAGIVLVDNTLKALQDLASFHLNGFPDLTRIGITGSNGKTTTKEIIGSIFSNAAETLINIGNMNSETGLPLSVFRVSRGVKYAVFEMAMNHEGEMDDLVRIVRPHAALITNIGTAHIEFLGSRERIAEEKKKIFKYFTGKERGFLFEGEIFYDYLKEGVRGQIIPFGPKSTVGYRGSRDLGLDGTLINWEGLQVHFPLFGYHNLINALAAITLSSAFGLSADAVKKGLERIKPLFGRSQIIRRQVTIIQDCYNANPDSMIMVLGYFNRLSWRGRKVAVLGSMLELGVESLKEHLKVAGLALDLTVDVFFFFGTEMEPVFEEFKSRGFDGLFYWTCDFDSLLSKLTNSVKAGDLILIKGSRGARLERLVEPLLKSAA